MPRITTHNLCKYFVDNKKKVATAALYNTEADMPDKSFTVIMGKSGCGKTTLLRTLAGLVRPDDGQILFNETDVTDKTAAERNVSYLSQEFALYPHLTVFDNVAYPLKLQRVPADEIRRRVDETCKLVGMAQLTSRRPRQLSGGQQQRVAMARALVKRPEIIFMDEPMSNLDRNLRAEMSALLARLHKTLDVNIVYVTHNINEARALADYVIAMDNGMVVQQGAASEVLSDSNGFVIQNLTEKTIETLI